MSEENKITALGMKIKVGDEITIDGDTRVILKEIRGNTVCMAVLAPKTVIIKRVKKESNEDHLHKK